jgi:hypothetical protein
VNFKTRINLQIGSRAFTAAFCVANSLVFKATSKVAAGTQKKSSYSKTHKLKHDQYNHHASVYTNDDDFTKESGCEASLCDAAISSTVHSLDSQ